MKTEKLPSLKDKMKDSQHLDIPSYYTANDVIVLLGVLEAHAKDCIKTQSLKMDCSESYWRGWLDCIKQIKGEK